MHHIGGKIYLFLAFSLAGTSVIASRLLMDQLGPFTITALSLLFSVLFLLPFCWKQIAPVILSISRYQLISLFMQAFCGIFLFRIFLLGGLSQTSSGEAGILTGATPAITALLAMLVLREAPNAQKLFGIASTVFGILMIQGLLLPGNHFIMNHLAGNALILCAAFSESVFNILSRISVLRAGTEQKQVIHPLLQTCFVSMIALVCCLLPASFEQPLNALQKIDFTAWLALLWYGVFVTALAFICWYAGIKRCNALTAAAFSGMMPFTAMILSVVILHEKLVWQQWLGGMLVISGMILIGIGGASKQKVMRTKLAEMGD